jgi:hypothetical protein
MTNLDIAHQRLYHQRLAGSAFERPGDIVHWLGAVQAQDYQGGLWAVGLRLPGATQGDIEQALADRAIVRTWPMRGTLHFVAAADVRWMLELLTPRVVAGSAGRLRQLEIDANVLARSRELFVQALRGGKQHTRSALYSMLEAGDVSTAGTRGLHILGQLAMEGLICFGAREGKQHTFVLLDEWLPDARRLERDAALAELARRYFTSRGPATLQDFVWWSGLTVADARDGLEMAQPHLAQAQIDGRTYWLAPSPPVAPAAAHSAYLLPMYDEYTVAYKDRGAVLNPAYAKQAGNAIFRPVMIVDGQVVGTWNRTLKQDTVALTTEPFTQLGQAERQAVAEAAERYGAFLGMPVVMSLK